MRIDAGLVLVLFLAAGCAGTLPPRSDTLDSASLGRFLAEAAALPAERLGAEVSRLQNGALTPPDRLKLAWLLARKGARPEDLARAQELLAGQETAYPDPGARQWFLLVQRVVRLEQELREEQRRGGALQDKIERLMNLERSLHERGKPQEAK
jgi:hypothetical protein